MAADLFAYAIAGLFGGLVRATVTGEGSLILPQLHERRLDLGSLSSLVIGAIVGAVAPYTIGVNSVISFFAGWTGADFIENVLERAMGKHAKPGERA